MLPVRWLLDACQMPIKIRPRGTFCLIIQIFYRRSSGKIIIKENIPGCSLIFSVLPPCISTILIFCYLPVAIELMNTRRKTKAFEVTMFDASFWVKSLFHIVFTIFSIVNNVISFSIIYLCHNGDNSTGISICKQRYFEHLYSYHDDLHYFTLSHALSTSRKYPTRAKGLIYKIKDQFSWCWIYLFL